MMTSLYSCFCNESARDIHPLAEHDLSAWLNAFRLTRDEDEVLSFMLDTKKKYEKAQQAIAELGLITTESLKGFCSFFL